MRRLYAACAFALLVAPACESGGAPTQPTQAARFLLPDGVYLLNLISFDLSEDPGAPPCQPVGVPAAGKIVAVRLMFRRQGDRYLGRSTNPAQTLELELWEVPTDQAFPATFAGLLRGQATDEGDLLRAPRDVKISVGDGVGPALVAGISTPVPARPFLDGRATGTVVFDDSGGWSSACQTVDFDMQPIQNLP